MNWKLNPAYPDLHKIGRPNIVQVGQLPKLVYRGNAFPSSAGKGRKKKSQDENRFFKIKKREKSLCIFL